MAFVPGQPHATEATFQTFEDSCPCLNTKIMTFEKLLCLTIMIYCNLAFSQSSVGLQPTLAFGARRTMLIDAILAFNTDLPVEKDCMLWMFIISIRSCMNRDGTVSPVGGLLLSRIRCQYAGLIWSQVEFTLNTFHWDPKVDKQLRHLLKFD